MKLIRSLTALGLVLGATAFVPADAEAALILRLSDGITPVEIQDGDLDDANPAAGGVTFIGSVGVFVVNVTTGLSDPILGSATEPHMDLNTVSVSSGAGTLTIELIDEDFVGAGTHSFAMNIGGTTGTTSSVTYNAYADGSLIDSLGPFGGPVFAATGGGSATVGSPYELMQQVIITHTGAGVTSLDAELIAPEPASLALLGLGLVGVGVGARRRRNAA